MNLRLIALVGAATALAAGAVTTTIAAAPAKPAAARPAARATLHEIMKDRIAPAADVVWMAVGSVDDHDVKPETPAQWKKVRDAALVLASAPGLVGPGLTVVKPGVKLADEGQDGNLTSGQMQKMIAANPGAFVAYAQALKVQADKVVTAVDHKDADAIMEIGGAIDEACEACHVKYWYPGAKQ